MILNAAMSLDGKIATRTGRARISCPEDLERMQALRASVDGIMIGVNTVIVDDPSLRLKIPADTPPTRIIVDSRLRTPASARIFSFPGPIIIATTERADPRRAAEIKCRAELITAGKERVDLNTLLQELAKRGFRRVLLEGGGTLNWSMLRAGLVDELRIAIAPFIIGGGDTITLVEGEGASSMEEAIQLELIDASRHGRDIVVSYRTRKRSP